MNKILLCFFLLTTAPMLQADTFTITVSTTTGARIKSAFGTAYNYSATMPDGSQNPESLAQFTLRKFKEWVKDVTVSQEATTAAAAAQQNQLNQSTIDIQIP